MSFLKTSQHSPFSTSPTWQSSSFDFDLFENTRVRIHILMVWSAVLWQPMQKIDWYEVLEGTHWLWTEKWKCPAEDPFLGHNATLVGSRPWGLGLVKIFRVTGDESNTTDPLFFLLMQCVYCLLLSVDMICMFIIASVRAAKLNRA